MAENTPNIPAGTPAGATPPPPAPPKPGESGKIQPKKETVRINLPPKPTAAPTIKIPAPSAISAAAPAAAASAAPARPAGAAPAAAAAGKAPTAAAAAFALNSAILLAIPLGVLLAVYLPGVDPEVVGPFRPAAYLTAFGFLALRGAVCGREKTVQDGARLGTFVRLGVELVELLGDGPKLRLQLPLPLVRPRWFTMLADSIPSTRYSPSEQQS